MRLGLGRGLGRGLGLAFRFGDGWFRRASGGVVKDGSALFIHDEDIAEGNGREVQTARVLAVALAVQGRQTPLPQFDLEADRIRQVADHDMDRAEQAGGVGIVRTTVRIGGELGVQARARVAAQTDRARRDLGRQIRHAVAHLPDHGVQDGAFEGREIGHQRVNARPGRDGGRFPWPPQHNDRASDAVKASCRSGSPRPSE